jgi:hypothetical protein
MPLGHFATCATMASNAAPSIFIHGLAEGLKTARNPCAQIPLWVQILGFQTTVMSPFV